MKQKPYATAFRLKLNLDRIKSEEMRKTIQFDIDQTKWFGVLYLSPTSPEIATIEELGFRLKKDKSGEYYVLPEN